MSYIDENTKNVGLGKSRARSQAAVPLLVNPATGELLVEIIPITDDGTIITRLNIPIDENTHQVSGAITDDSDQTITPLTVEETKGVTCLRVETL